MWPFSKRCQHEWEALDKTVLPSAFEQMNATDRLLQINVRNGDTGTARRWDTGGFVRLR